MNDLELAKDHALVGKNCDTDAMFQCYLAQMKYVHKTNPPAAFADNAAAAAHQADIDFLTGSCAKAHKCEADATGNVGNKHYKNSKDFRHARRVLSRRI